MKAEDIEAIHHSITKDNLNKIPEGHYCYTMESYNKDTGQMKVKCCSFWELADDKSEMNCGACTLFRIYDWEDDGVTSLLWDSVKECSEHMGEDEYEE